MKLGFSTWTKPGLPIDTSVRELAPSASRGVEITVIPLVLDRARHPGGRRAPSHPLSVHTHVKDERCRIPGEGEFDYVQYLREMRKAGYNGFITAEISMQVQRPPAYDPLAAAAMTYRTLDAAFSRSGYLVPGLPGGPPQPLMIIPLESWRCFKCFGSSFPFPLLIRFM